MSGSWVGAAVTCLSRKLVASAHGQLQASPFMLHRARSGDASPRVLNKRRSGTRGFDQFFHFAFGFDHGVGPPLLFLYDAKTSHGENIINFNGLGYDPSAGLYRSILDHNKIYH